VHHVSIQRVTGTLDSLISGGWNPPSEDDSGVRHCTRPDGSEVSYDSSHDSYPLDILGPDGGHGFWFDHRFETVLELVRHEGVTCLWDVGAGTGSMVGRLSQAGVDVVAVEPLRAGAEASARLGVTSFCGTLQDLHLPDACLPAIGMFDVLEHLEYPEELLKEAHRVLQPDGILVVTVPALKWLWGDEDDVTGHFRRYRKTSLDESVSAAAFRPLTSQYLFASLVPAAALLRALPHRLGHRKPEVEVLANMKRQLDMPAPMDQGMRWLMRAETAWSKTFPLPAGLSIAASFRRVGAGLPV
jgi:SAM-dependent methyltransferase